MKAQYEIKYADHDMGATGGHMIREGKETAERTARLMRECGSRLVEVECIDPDPTCPG